MPAKKAKAKPTSVTVRLAVHTGDATATFYVNIAEVASTPHDFTLLCSKMPAKLQPLQFADVEKTGVLTMEAAVQLVFPLTLMPGLIRALTTQKEQYEKQFGITLSEPEAGTRTYEH